MQIETLEIDNSPVITQKLQNLIPIFKKYFKEKKINLRNFKIIEDKFLVLNLVKGDDYYNIRYQTKPFMIWIWISGIIRSSMEKFI